MTPSEFRQWRRRINLTQEQAGAKFNQSRFTILNWETEKTPLPDYVDDLCRMFEREIRQRLDDFPVQLAYLKTAPWAEPDGSTNYVQVENFLRNSDMLRRAHDLVRAGTFFLAAAVDAANPEIIIWHHDELVKGAKSAR